MDVSTGARDQHLTSRWRRTLQSKISTWYIQQRRELPWRTTHDPYAIWLSEIMLQQTQVATVIAYYYQFLERFPTVRHLADADEQEVLRLWAGLGYYRRAKQLHAAARAIVDQHGGDFPRDVKLLENLPGIGRYTAGAIASFAFDLKAPIVEANTLRLFSRLLCMREPPRSTAGQSRLWDFAEWILPARTGSGQLNQALMELGSQVCVPRDPDCPRCPLAKLCPTYHQGLQHEIPSAPAKKVFKQLWHVAVIVQRKTRKDRREILMRHNSTSSWWAGLWDVPRCDVTQVVPYTSNRTVNVQNIRWPAQQCFEEQFAIGLSLDEHIATLRHTVTRYRIRLDCFQGRLTGQPQFERLGSEFRWIKEADIDKLPLSSTAKKICSLFRQNAFVK